MFPITRSVLQYYHVSLDQAIYPVRMSPLPKNSYKHGLVTESSTSLVSYPESTAYPKNTARFRDGLW